jgi:hypothetical protein
MQKAEFELVAKTDKAEANINKVDDVVKKTGKSVKKTKKELSGMQQIGNAALGGLDRMTGGLASKLVGVAKAAKLSGKAMKTALISSGIGLAVVAIALIVENWEKITSLVDGVSSEQEKQLQATQDSLAANEEQLNVIGQTENTLRLQGKTEKEILDMKMAVTDESIANTKILLEQQKQQKKSQIEAAERNKKIATGIIAFLSAPILVLLGLVDGLTNSLASIGILDEGTKLTEGFLDMTSSLLFDPEEVAEKGDETVKATEEALRKLENTRDGFILKEQERKKKENEKTTKTEKVEVDPEVAAKAKAIEEIAKLEDAHFQSQLSAKTQEENLVREKYYGIIEQAKKYKQDTTDLTEAQEAELAAIRKKYADEAKLVKAEQTAQDIQDDKDERDRKFALYSKIADMAAQALSTIAGMQKARHARENQEGAQDEKSKEQRARRQFKEQKKMNLAMAVVNASQSVISSLAQAPVAIGLVPNPIGIASLALALSSGAASIAAIAKTTFNSGAGSVAKPSGGGGGSQAPAFNVVGASGTDQLGDAIAGQSQRPARAYVVSSDVTTAQQLDRNIIEGASI